MSGACFHQWFLRAWCPILHFPQHPINVLSEPSLMAFALSVTWWERIAQIDFHIILSCSSDEDISLALVIIVGTQQIAPLNDCILHRAPYLVLLSFLFL